MSAGMAGVRMVCDTAEWVVIFENHDMIHPDGVLGRSTYYLKILCRPVALDYQISFCGKDRLFVFFEFLY